MGIARKSEDVEPLKKGSSESDSERECSKSKLHRDWIKEKDKERRKELERHTETERESPSSRLDAKERERLRDTRGEKWRDKS